MSVTSIKVKPVTTLEELKRYKEAWENLASLDSRDGFFRSWDWQVLWYKHFGTEGSLLTLIIENDLGEIQAILPMAQTKLRLLPGLRCNVLGFMGREIVTGDYLDILAPEKDKAHLLQIAVDWLLKNHHSSTFMMLGEILEGSQPWQLAHSKALRHKSIRFQEQRICPFISLPSTFEDYLQTLSKKFRWNVKYYKRRILTKLNGTIRINNDKESIVDALEDLFELHIKRWQDRGIACTFTNPTFQEFIKDLCQSLADKDQVKLYRLFIDEKPVAAVLMFYWQESAIFYQTGWDPEYRKFSPGVALLSQTVEDAILEGRKYYDFLRGDEDYKLNWTNEHRLTTTMLVPSRLCSSFFLFALKLKDFAKELLKKD